MTYLTQIKEPNSETYETLDVEIQSLTDHFHEQLDSATIVIPFSTRKEKYPRFSKVRIWIDNVMFGMVVWGDEVDVQTKDPTYYEHIIAIMEPTKVLERTRVSALTFTQPLDGVRYTMKNVVNRIIDIAPLAVTGTHHANTRVCTISSALASRLDNITAPQFFLQPGNMREILIQVLSYVNAVPRLTDEMVLEATFFEDTVDGIDFEDTVGYKSSIDAEDYATTMETYVGNMISEKDADSTGMRVMSRRDVVSVRAESLIIGDSNWRIELPYRIHRLSKIEAYIMITNPGLPLSTTEYVDISKYIFPKDEYDTLPISSSGLPDFAPRKPNSGWYEIGGRTIEGLTETWGAFGMIQTWDQLIATVMQQYEHPDYPGEPGLFDAAPQTIFDVIMFRITYVPALDSRIQIEREDVSDIQYNTVILGNTRGNVVDMFGITNNMFGRIQRLGIATELRGVVCTDVSEILPLGHKVNGGVDIITDREIICFPNFFVVRYETTPRFNRLSQFINVDRQFRALEIVQDNPAIDRREIFKEYITIDKSDHIEFTGISSMETFMGVFESGTTPQYSVNVAYVTVDLPVVARVLLPCVSIAGRNTMLFEYTFMSPNMAGKAVDELNDRLVQRAVWYTKDDGTCTTVRARFYDHFFEAETGPHSPPSEDPLRDDYLPKARKFPGTEGTHTAAQSPVLLDTGMLRVVKDTSERLIMGYQIQILPGKDMVDNVVIGTNITTMNPLVRNYDSPKPTLKVWTTNSPYRKTEFHKAKGSVDELLSIGITGNKISLLITPPSSPTQLTSLPVGTHWAIADESGNLYLAVNQITESTSELYFNPRRYREGVLYQYD